MPFFYVGQGYESRRVLYRELGTYQAAKAVRVCLFDGCCFATKETNNIDGVAAELLTWS